VGAWPYGRSKDFESPPATTVTRRAPLWTFAPFRSMTGWFPSRSSGSSLSRVFASTALAETRSDLPGVTKSRLRCVFNVSHVLDALFLSQPVRLVSAGNTLEIEPSEGFPFRDVKAGFRPLSPRMALALYRRLDASFAAPCPPRGYRHSRKSVAASASTGRLEPPLDFSSFRDSNSQRRHLTVAILP